MARIIGLLMSGALLALAVQAKEPLEVSPEDMSPGCNNASDLWEIDDVTWTQVATAPVVFGRSGAGVIGNYMYVFGAEGVNVAIAFNLNSEQWEQSTPATYGYDNWASAATSDAIYLIGGLNGSTALNHVQKFVPAGGGPTGTWTQMAPYPHHVYGPTAAWDGGNIIYAAGGDSENVYFYNAYKYDIANNAWTPIADVPVIMSFSGSAFVAGQFYCFGGTDVTGLGKRNYAYDPAADTWTQKASIPIPVWWATGGATFNDSYMFSIGGGPYWYPPCPAVQIYDPANDSWSQETPLPVGRVSNVARWAPPDKVISGGGYIGGYSGVTYHGEGFPSGAPPNNISISLTPISPPIQIPATGGSFNFDVDVVNGETAPQSFDAWIMVQLPNSSWWGPALGPIALTLPGNFTLSRLRTQTVPGSAPAGDYLYEGRVGTYPGTIWDSSNFPFTKLDSVHHGAGLGEWTNTGEDFTIEAGAQSAAANAPSGSGATPTMEVMPNPFNPTTAINYQLAANSYVSLKVYDTAGKLVQALADGWREAGTHQAVFDGSQLASGIYVYQLTAGSFNASGKMVLMK